MKVNFKTTLLPIRMRIVEAKDVRFRDYDGTVLHSMSVSEARALTALPELPTHKGLVCQGWNWSLDDLHSLTQEADIGANFITEDGKTRLHIVVPAGDSHAQRIEVSFVNKLHVDWGDGSEPYVEENDFDPGELSPAWGATHTYPVCDEDKAYVITVWDEENAPLRFGKSDFAWTDVNIFGTYSYSERNYYGRLRAVEFGKITGSYRDRLFMDMGSLEAVTLPNNVTEFGIHVINGCLALRHVTIPAGTASLAGGSVGYSGLTSVSIPKSLVRLESCVFSGCKSLNRVCLNPGTTFAGSTSFDGAGITFLRVPEGTPSLPLKFVYSCEKLERIVIPRSVKTIPEKAFSECESLLEIDIPEGVTELPQWCFHNSKALRRINLPSTLTTVKGYGLCTDAETGTTVLDFRSTRQIPTLTDEYGVTRAAKIIVPDDLYESWKAADIWKKAASVIVKASEA